MIDKTKKIHEAARIIQSLMAVPAIGETEPSESHRKVDDFTRHVK